MLGELTSHKIDINAISRRGPRIVDEDACARLRESCKAAQSDEWLWRKALKAEESDLMVIREVRQFWDPASCQQANRTGADQPHTGMHAVHASVQQPLFFPPSDAGGRYPSAFKVFLLTWRTILDQISSGRQTGSGSRPIVVHVIWLCNAGRHRSVAFATVLHKVISGLTRWRCNEAHISRKHWHYRCCDGCQECVHPTVYEERVQLGEIEVPLLAAPKS